MRVDKRAAIGRLHRIRNGDDPGEIYTQSIPLTIRLALSLVRNDEQIVADIALADYPPGDTCELTRQELIAEVERLKTLLSFTGGGIGIQLGHTDEDPITKRIRESVRDAEVERLKRGEFTQEELRAIGLNKLVTLGDLVSKQIMNLACGGGWQ